MRSLHQPTDCPQVTGLQPGQASLVCPPPSLEDDVFAPPEEEEREVEEREVGEERQRFRQAVASMRPEEVFPHRVRWQRHGNQTQPSMHDLINVGINPCPLSTEKRLTKV